MRSIPTIPSLNPQGIIGGGTTNTGGGLAPLTYDLVDNGSMQIRTSFALADSKPYTLMDGGTMVKTTPFAINNSAFATISENADFFYYVTGSIT